MKTILLIAVILLFAVAAFAQGAAQPAIKVMFVNTTAFEAKDGITRYNNAIDTVNKEFETTRADIRNMMTRHDALAKEVTQIQTTLNSTPNPQLSPLVKQLETKVDEGRNLETEIKRKQEDARVRYERREAEVLGPIRADIGRAMDDFAKQRGYSVILDPSKMAQAILVYDAAKADVTKDFITFYNARPPTAPRP